MTDLTQRIIAALRRAVISARNADEAREAEFLADSIEEMGSSYSKMVMVPPGHALDSSVSPVVATPVVEMTAEPAAAQEAAPPAPEVVHTS